MLVPTDAPQLSRLKQKTINDLKKNVAVFQGQMLQHHKYFMSNKTRHQTYFSGRSTVFLSFLLWLWLGLFAFYFVCQ